MKLIHKNHKIEKICNDESHAKRLYNQEVSDCLFKVLQILEDSPNLIELSQMKRYNLHKLKNDFKNIYSIYLLKTSGFRLLIEICDENDNLIIESDEKLTFTNARTINVIEISKHYKK